MGNHTNAAPASAIALPPPATWTACRSCGCHLGEDEHDDLTRGLCVDCKARPDVLRRFGTTGPRLAAVPAKPQTFGAAERSLIRSLHALVPPRELLRILNERLVADLGSHVRRHTLEDLHQELQTLNVPAVAGADDWSGLRQLLAQARRSGILAAITPTVIEDFSVVFQLAPAQLMHLKDVIAHAKEGS